MSKIADLISSLKSMELPKGAESLLSSIGTEASALEADRDDLKGKVETRQTENQKLKDRAQAAEAKLTDLPDADTLAAYTALGKPDEIKTKLEAGEQAARAVKTQANRDALATLGLKPSVLRLREFEGVIVTAKKEGDMVTATVKDGDAEKPWAEWVKEKELEDDLKDLTLTETVTVVRALGQVSGGKLPPKTDAVDALNNQLFGTKNK